LLLDIGHDPSALEYLIWVCWTKLLFNTSKHERRVVRRRLHLGSALMHLHLLKKISSSTLDIQENGTLPNWPDMPIDCGVSRSHSYNLKVHWYVGGGASARNHLSQGYSMHRCYGQAIEESLSLIAVHSLMHSLKRLKQVIHGEPDVSADNLLGSNFKWLPKFIPPQTSEVVEKALGGA